MMKQYPFTTYWQSIVSGVTTVDYSGSTLNYERWYMKQISKEEYEAIKEAEENGTYCFERSRQEVREALNNYHGLSRYYDVRIQQLEAWANEEE